MKTLNLKGYLTVREVRYILGRNGKLITRQRVHQLIEKGQIKAERPAPRLVLIKKKSVEEYLKARNANRERRE